MIRFKGEDVKKGNLLLSMYKHLNGYSLALLSSQGITPFEGLGTGLGVIGALVMGMSLKVIY